MRVPALSRKELHMTDKDVEREIEANKQRELERDRVEEDDGPVVDTAERIVDPLARGIGTNDDEERESVEQRRRENDAEQHPE
jgi:hypothetical protein